MSGTLYLIPTPIDGESKLAPENYDLIVSACENVEGSIFVMEDPKPARRAWLRFGLDRDFINDFVYYNEQTRGHQLRDLISQLKAGKDIYLMSDCGLPAFCDPGAELVNACHNEQIRVSSGKYNNSVSLALALSGFNHNKFNFYGFAPRKHPERSEELSYFIKSKVTSIIMDTPYRLHRLLQEVEELERGIGISGTYLIALDLNKATELVLRGKIKKIIKAVSAVEKREFILVRGEPSTM